MKTYLTHVHNWKSDSPTRLTFQLLSSNVLHIETSIEDEEGDPQDSDYYVSEDLRFILARDIQLMRDKTLNETAIKIDSERGKRSCQLILYRLGAGWESFGMVLTDHIGNREVFTQLMPDEVEFLASCEEPTRLQTPEEWLASACGFAEEGQTNG